MKSLIPWLAIAGLAAVLCGCAMLPTKADIAEAVAAPALDAAAVRFETAVAVMATSVEVAARQPDPGVDKVKLARAIRKAASVLGDARVAFDARSGDPATLVSMAFDAIDDAVPPTANVKIRFALALGRGAAVTYATGLTLAGPPSPPSEQLRMARASADEAIGSLLASLPPPES